MMPLNSYWLVLSAFATFALAQEKSGSGGSSGKNSSSANSSGSKSGKHPESPLVNVDNVLFANYILTTLASIVVAILIYRVIIYAIRYIRTLVCLNDEKQQYFQLPSHLFANVKEHLIYAPLFRTRHLGEWRLSSASSLRVLPTRFQSIFLIGIIGMNVALCISGIEWRGEYVTMLKHLRNRTGTLAVVNMIPLVLLAGRNNPLIPLLAISFDSFNLVHRWFGRIVVAEAVAHTVAFTTATVHTAGWNAVQEAVMTSVLIYTGLIGTIAFIAIILQANSILRHAFYETFLHLHIALVILSLVGLWMHLRGLPQQAYLKTVIALWAAERFIRFSSLIYRNFGHDSTLATIESLPGDAMRVTLRPARPISLKPGQYIFLTIPSVGLWTSHPFSIAWSESSRVPNFDLEKAFSPTPASLSAPQSTISLVIRRRTGFTDTLHNRVSLAPSGKITTSALIEGPYGGQKSLTSYGTVVLFAAGVGITSLVPSIRLLIAGSHSHTVATRKLVLVWIIRSPEHLEWIRPWMTTILSMPGRREVLRIQIFVTQPRSAREIRSPSETVQMFPGKPDVGWLVGRECDGQVGAMGVAVCGTGGLADEVRRAVRGVQTRANVDFLEESFSW